MFKLIKLAPLVLMAWRWYKGQKSQKAAAGYNPGNNPGNNTTTLNNRARRR